MDADADAAKDADADVDALVNHAHTQKYCWTHGNCLHSGTECESKAEGHINGATYENRQNGSNARCNGAGS